MKKQIERFSQFIGESWRFDEDRIDNVNNFAVFLIDLEKFSARFELSNGKSIPMRFPDWWEELMPGGWHKYACKYAAERTDIDCIYFPEEGVIIKVRKDW